MMMKGSQQRNIKPDHVLVLEIKLRTISTPKQKKLFKEVYHGS
jgi:hypothetical protein